ncbi:MAG: hypothetical protein U9P10_05750 [Thermodesulfobacteriota bacterium]|nr:hypothetical protein [Thermodesulfobacteriota bacterium]
MIQKTYGHKPVYLAAVHVRENREVVCGILPMFVFQSMAGERRLVSLPFVDTAGILADSKVIEHMLFNRAADLMRKTGCKAMDIRQDRPLWCSGRIEGFNINISSLKVGLKLTLGASQQELKNRFKSKLRSQVNWAVKNGLKAETGKKEWQKTLPANALNPEFVVMIKDASFQDLKLAGARTASVTMEKDAFLLSLVPEHDHIYLTGMA